MATIRCAECGLVCEGDAPCSDCSGTRRYESTDIDALARDVAIEPEKTLSSTFARIGEGISVQTDSWSPTDLGSKLSLGSAPGVPAPSSPAAARVPVMAPSGEPARPKPPAAPVVPAAAQAATGDSSTAEAGTLPKKVESGFGCAVWMLIGLPALYFGIKGCERAVLISRMEGNWGPETFVEGVVGFFSGCISGALFGLEWAVGLADEAMRGVAEAARSMFS